jgi:hypothetical protein
MPKSFLWNASRSPCSNVVVVTQTNLFSWQDLWQAGVSNIENGKSQNSNPEARPKSVIRKGLPESFPTSVQKSYFMLSDAERNVLNIGLQKYWPGQSEPILIGGEKLLKPALRLVSESSGRREWLRHRIAH